MLQCHGEKLIRLKRVSYNRALQYLELHMTHNASVGNETNDNIQEILKNYNRDLALKTSKMHRRQKTKTKTKY